MALSSRRRAMATAAVGLLTTGFCVSCGGNTTSSSQSSPAAGATTTSQPNGVVRLGCGTYCQSAGVVNGGVGPGRESVTIVSSGTITADANGYVPVTLTCNLSVQCRGAITLSIASAGEVARSDLVVNAGATATLGVQVSARALYFLQVHGPTGVEVTADDGPALGVSCASSPQPGLPVWNPDNGPINGFTPLSVTDLTIAASG
jgi:hypothetical protein